MASSAALPLKVTPANTPSKLVNSERKETSPAPTPPKQAGLSDPSDISSPHELTAFVENLLEQLDSKFDEMSSQILDRMMQMSSRVDALEASIQDIINGDISTPSNPSTPGPTSTSTPVPPKRTGSFQ
ncbi:hypothetical protein EW146_g6386 [Bondarzewia mesenterica]|uniref:Heat shock factor-binding protein 1 n=1 Tax=Bondarzewia mesenterica TaxID=1095465 RepID=A0A4S4LNN0_9AGAM|nr:hypothetical protein EW146_g6386 [Bondarzewia mesenterica]